MKLKMNKIIKVLILSDFYLIMGDGLVAPIFAIFLTDQIHGGNIKVAGYAAAIYLVVKSLVVIPFGMYLDKNHGEKDDLWFIVIGNLLAASVFFAYIFSYLPWHIYFLQAVYALGMGMNIPAYAAMFTRHIDKDREAFDWSVRSSFIGIGGAVAAALGGIIASYFGFKVLFIGTGIFILISAFIPFLIYNQIYPKDKKVLRKNVKTYRLKE